MLYWLFQWLAAHHWVPGVQSDGGSFVLFRAAASVMCGFLIVLFSGGPVIRWLFKQKVGDRPEFYNATLNEMTRHKENVPTMGGLLIISAIVVTTFLLAEVRNFYVEAALFCLVYLGVLGAIDDWLKLTTARRSGDTRPRLQLGSIMFDCMMLGNELLSLKCDVNVEDPLWSLLCRLGIKRIWHLPTVPMEIPPDQLLRAQGKLPVN